MDNEMYSKKKFKELEYEKNNNLITRSISCKNQNL